MRWLREDFDQFKHQVQDVALSGSNVTFDRLIYPVGDLVKLNIPTYDGANQPIHPSVVMIPDKLNGYKYWMAFTPYPDLDSTKENPSIIASNDGYNWEVPNGLVNPVEPAPGTGWYADTNLIFDGQKLCLYWLHAGPSKVYRKTSTDGVNWTAKEEVTGGVSLKHGLYYDGSQYFDLTNVPYLGWNDIYQKRKSTDGLVFTSTNNRNVITNLRNIGGAHGSVYYDGAGFHFLTNSQNQSQMQRNSLHYGFSQDGDRVIFDPVPVLTPDLDIPWMSQTLYTSCIVPGEKDEYLLYVSAFSQDNKTSIGVMPVKLNLSHLNFGLPVKRGFTRTLFDKVEIRSTSVTSAPSPSPFRLAVPEFNEFKEKVVHIRSSHDQPVEIVFEQSAAGYREVLMCGSTRVQQKVTVPSGGFVTMTLDSSDLKVLGIVHPEPIYVGVKAVSTAPTTGDITITMTGV